MNTCGPALSLFQKTTVLSKLFASFKVKITSPMHYGRNTVLENEYIILVCRVVRKLLASLEGIASCYLPSR